MFRFCQQNYPANKSYKDKNPTAVPVPEGHHRRVQRPQQGTEDQAFLRAAKSTGPKATTSSDHSPRRHNTKHKHSSLSDSATD